MEPTLTVDAVPSFLSTFRSSGKTLFLVVDLPHSGDKHTVSSVKEMTRVIRTIDAAVKSATGKKYVALMTADHATVLDEAFRSFNRWLSATARELPAATCTPTYPGATNCDGLLPCTYKGQTNCNLQNCVPSYPGANMTDTFRGRSLHLL